MDKTDYILRSLSKITKKRWEHYAITRIFHLLNDLDIEFVCQQCIRKDAETYYLADLYFPQLKIYLEIDEGHHDLNLNKIADAKREIDIVTATGLQEHRISANGVTLDMLNTEIDVFIERVKKLKAQLMLKGTFTCWDLKNRFTAQPHLDKKLLTMGPDAVFRTHKDALECFGYNKGHYQRAVWNLPANVRDAVGLKGNCMVWFPKLYRQKNWVNSLSDDGKTITEINKTSEGHYREKWDRRIVMAHSRDALNRTLYRFLGVFRVLPDSNEPAERKFIRMQTSLPTFCPRSPI